MLLHVRRSADALLAQLRRLPVAVVDGARICLYMEVDVAAERLVIVETHGEFDRRHDGGVVEQDRLV